MQRAGVPMLATGPPDMRSLLVALAGGVVFFVLAALCLALARVSPSLASVWMPSAAAVALLLLARPKSEVPAYAAIGLAALSAHLGNESTLVAALAAVWKMKSLLNSPPGFWSCRRCMPAVGRASSVTVMSLSKGAARV